MEHRQAELLYIQRNSNHTTYKDYEYFVKLFYSVLL